jgi:hypothetical protein
MEPSCGYKSERFFLSRFCRFLEAITRTFHSSLLPSRYQKVSSKILATVNTFGLLASPTGFEPVLPP